MADTKISALTAATTPLAGTEVLPIVQSGVTKQVSVADLTAGRAVSAASLTLTTALTAANGGTGQLSYTVGDLLYASTTTALSKLADVATGNALISGGVGVAPSWGKIALTTHVSGVLPVANGGTNASSASITAFNNITGYTASGATGTTSTNLVFSTSPSITTATLVGDNTLSTGNLIQGTAAKGFNFTANSAAAGMTSQLLNWYETGTFTPTYYGSTTAGTTTYTLQSATYTRIGNVLYYNIRIAWSNATGTGNGTIGGFPYNAQNAYHTASVLPSDYTLTALNIMSARIGFGNTMALFQTPVGGGTQTAVGMDTAAELTITGFYLI
jgi:hypothetical protein